MPARLPFRLWPGHGALPMIRAHGCYCHACQQGCHRNPRWRGELRGSCPKLRYHRRPVHPRGAGRRLSPKQRFLTGPPKLNPYKVLVHQDGQPTITVDGSMQQEGLIPKWLVPALIGLAALVIILAILWITLLKPAISSAATAAVAPQASAAQSAAAKASTAASNATQKAPSGGGGVTGANPVGGDAWSARLAINPGSKPLESSITVPQGGGLAVTDLVFENPSGNSGTVYLVRRQSAKADQVL